jgi:hypothetical protein
MRHHDLEQFNRWPAVELDRGHPAIERFDRGSTEIPSAEELPKVRPGRHVEEPHAMHLTEHPGLDQNSAQGPAGRANRRCGCRIEVGEINPHDSVLDDRPVRCFEQNLPRFSPQPDSPLHSPARLQLALVLLQQHHEQQPQRSGARAQDAVRGKAATSGRRGGWRRIARRARAK